MREPSIGVSPPAELVYRTLLRRVRWRPAELATVLGWSADKVKTLVGELRDDGLVATSADDATAFRAVEPRLALPTLTMRRLRHHTGGEAPSAIDVPRFIMLHEHTTDRLHDHRQVIGLDDVGAVVERLVAGAKREAVLIVARFRPGSFEFSEHVADAIMRRRLRLRAVWQSSFLDLPAVLAHARWLGARGVVPRTVECVPTQVTILDGATAVMIDGDHRAQVVRSAPAVEALSGYATKLWEKAVEVKAAAEAGTWASDRDRSEVVLWLLADGLTDEAMARRLGVSVRTIRTEIAHLMTGLNARSRFQAGLRAAHTGLL